MRLWVWQGSVYAWFIYLVIAMNAGSQSEAMLSTPLLSLSMMQHRQQAAAPYFQHEQGEGEWRWYLFQMNPGEAELEMWRGLLVMCCDVLCSLPGFTILCKKFAIKQLMSDTNTNNC